MKQGKSFFSDKAYRKAKLNVWKLRIYSLPVIKHVRICSYALRITGRTMRIGLQEEKRIEKDYNRKTFIWYLYKLEAAMLIKKRDKKIKEFMKVREELMRNVLINNKKLINFKQWLLNTNTGEEDFARVQAVINDLSKKGI